MSEALTALARQVTGGRCQVATVPVALGDPGALLGNEAEAISGAVPARQREFAAGRVAARMAMGQPLALPMGPDRAPIWPAGWSGSITHAGLWAVAAALRGQGLVGLDMEPDEDLPAEILDTVLTPVERSVLRDLRQARRIFAIKEAAYKAQYPLSGQIFGFEVFEVRLGGAGFAAVFQQDIGPFRRGEALIGLAGVADGFVMAGIVRQESGRG